MKSSWQERHLHVVYEAQQTARQKILEANTRNDSIIHSIIYQERQYGSQETGKHKSAIDSLKEDHAKEIEGLRKKLRIRRFTEHNSKETCKTNAFGAFQM